MMGKITTGASFLEAIGYDEGLNNGSKIVRTLAFSGVRMRYDLNGKPTPDVNEVANSFELQAGMRPRVEKPVIHIALSWPQEDITRLSDDELKEASEEYLEKMGWNDTQYIITRHEETNNPHVHIAINKIDNRGNILNVFQERKRNAWVCRQMTLERRYTWGRHKTFHMCEIPLNSDSRCYESVRYDMAKGIALAISQIDDIWDLPAQLQINQSGISAEFKYDKYGKSCGIVFSKMGRDSKGHQKIFRMSGKRIDRNMTLQSLKRIVEFKGQFQEISRNAQELLALYLNNEYLYAERRDVVNKVKQLETYLHMLESDVRFLQKELPKASYQYRTVLLALQFLDPLMRLENELNPKKILQEEYLLRVPDSNEDYVRSEFQEQEEVQKTEGKSTYYELTL